MKTVIFNTDTKVIKGFGEAQIDPVETMKLVNNKILKTTEVKNVDGKKQSFKSLSIARKKAFFDSSNVFYLCAARLGMSEREMSFLLSTNPNEAKAKLNASEISKYDECVNRIRQRDEDMQLLFDDLKPMKSAVDKKKKELIESEAIYFEPAPYEKIITDAEYNNYRIELEKLKEGEKLTIDMKVIPAPVKEQEVIEEG